MFWVSIGLLVVIICFSFVLLFGAPYLPTLNKQVKSALELADLQSGHTLIELGSGDGKILLAAAARGCQVIGYELNPLLVVVSKVRCWRYRQQVSIRWGNFWQADWPAADVFFTFLLPKYMSRLDKKIVQYSGKPVKLVSFAFTIPGRDVTAEKDGVYLYEYR